MFRQLESRAKGGGCPRGKSSQTLRSHLTISQRASSWPVVLRCDVAATTNKALGWSWLDALYMGLYPQIPSPRLTPQPCGQLRPWNMLVRLSIRPHSNTTEAWERDTRSKVLHVSSRMCERRARGLLGRCVLSSTTVMLRFPCDFLDECDEPNSFSSLASARQCCNRSMCSQLSGSSEVLGRAIPNRRLLGEKQMATMFPSIYISSTCRSTLWQCDVCHEPHLIDFWRSIVASECSYNEPHSSVFNFSATMAGPAAGRSSAHVKTPTSIDRHASMPILGAPEASALLLRTQPMCARIGPFWRKVDGWLCRFFCSSCRHKRGLDAAGELSPCSWHSVP